MKATWRTYDLPDQPETPPEQTDLDTWGGFGVFGTEKADGGNLSEIPGTAVFATARFHKKFMESANTAKGTKCNNILRNESILFNENTGAKLEEKPPAVGTASVSASEPRGLATAQRHREFMERANNAQSSLCRNILKKCFRLPDESIGEKRGEKASVVGAAVSASKKERFATAQRHKELINEAQSPRGIKGEDTLRTF